MVIRVLEVVKAVWGGLANARMVGGYALKVGRILAWILKAIPCTAALVSVLVLQGQLVSLGVVFALLALFFVGISVLRVAVVVHLVVCLGKLAKMGRVFVLLNSLDALLLGVMFVSVCKKILVIVGFVDESVSPIKHVSMGCANARQGSLSAKESVLIFSMMIKTVVGAERLVLMGNFVLMVSASVLLERAFAL